MKAKGKKNKRSFFRILFLVLNYPAALLLLLSYLAAYTSPANSWMLAFSGLAYPFLLLINVGFILIWFIRFEKTFILSLICILVGWTYPGRFYQFSGKEANKSEEATSVMTYNVHFFSTYGKNAEPNPDEDNIYDYISEKLPDIACFQEYHSAKDKDKLYSILRKQDKTYQRCFFPYVSNTETMGMAIISRHKIIRCGAINTEPPASRIFAIFTDLLVNSDTIRVYNLHLQSIRLSDEEFMFTRVPGLDDLQDKQKLKSDSKQILSKLKTAFVKRSHQVDAIAGHISQCTYPIIVCGDFNDTPASYAYRKVKKGLVDAFVESGKGTGQSYLGKYPSFRIDYIMHSKSFISSGFETGGIHSSDHLPIFTMFTKNP